MYQKKKDKGLKTYIENLTDYNKKMEKESDQKRKITARANHDESVKTQKKEEDSKRMQNDRANRDESLKTQKKELDLKR